MRRADGERVAALSRDFVQSLHIALLEQFAENAQDLLYRSGYDWGLQDMVRLTRQLKKQSGADADLWQMDEKSVFEAWWSALAETGWGRTTFDISGLARGIVIVELHDSAVVAAVGESDQPICHWYAGLFAAAVSFCARAERHGVEVQCAALGAPTCQFVIATGADVDAAETWRQQGAKPADIIRRLR